MIKNEIRRQFKTAFLTLITLTVLLGFGYPLLITVVAQTFLANKANGSFIEDKGAIVGSALIGQNFTDAKYFWGRPSATTPFPYNSLVGSGSNLGPTNPLLLQKIQARIRNLQAYGASSENLVPVDLVTASGSGLDPDISPFAAYYQIHRVAKARGLSESKVEELVLENITDRQFGFLGEPRVNVLKLNLALDQLKNKSSRRL
jgi:K+-transporting ATPase ATPase C chain